MRMRKKPWAPGELMSNDRLVREPGLYKGCWDTYFDNSDPVHIELGCGKGRFITQMSAAYPDVNFLALEREEVVLAAALRKARLYSSEAAFIQSDVKDLPEYFNKGEIKRIYINFCDPWENKKKWAKRRLTHVKFLDLYRELMGPGGEIFFKTDNRKLFEFSINQFTERQWVLRNISLDLHRDARECVVTEYEERFMALGVPIYYLEAYDI